MPRFPPTGKHSAWLEALIALELFLLAYVSVLNLLSFMSVHLVYFFFFLAAPMACGSSQARDGALATAVT